MEKKIFFFSFRELLHYFLVVSLPEKMIRKCLGVKEKKKRAKKRNFKEKGVKRFFYAL